jgi:hypothetical protein
MPAITIIIDISLRLNQNYYSDGWYYSQRQIWHMLYGVLSKFNPTKSKNTAIISLS